ncbi:HAD family hydrolase [Streptomyces coeruleorubidus]|uniref:HAD family hydrolase n=1 Tax=Streptomyces coeruleorubidus TaxID=116188 RepID=UPI0018765FB2|nr:HAD hydrolase-like protein [Streptomyces bellus]GGT82177.1 haloacid dehalogenase [Streptomyces bellus]
MGRRLVLWDIDHTLVDTRGVGRALFEEAFRQVTGRNMERQAKIDGLTEPVIFRETAKLHGLDAGREQFEEFAKALAECHLRRVAELRERGHALPGAVSVLTALAAVPSVVQTVVTGNILAVAEVKLTAFGLDGHVDLALGAFGEDADERTDLVRLALERAAVSASDAVLVGDTPADVRAGLDADVRVVAVASGKSSEQDLTKAGATETVPDLADTRRLVQLLAG